MTWTIREWIVVALLLICTVTDLRSGKIFNAVTLPALVLGVAYQTWIAALPGVAAALLGLAVAFLLFFPLYLLHAFAAGDVKLLMAVGAWTSATTVFEMGAVAILVGAVVALSVLLRRVGFSQGMKSVGKHLRGQATSGQKMPFAPAFLCAFFLLEVAERYQWRFF